MVGGQLWSELIDLKRMISDEEKESNPEALEALEDLLKEVYW